MKMHRDRSERNSHPSVQTGLCCGTSRPGPHGRGSRAARVLLLTAGACGAALVQDLMAAGKEVIRDEVDSVAAFTRALQTFAPDVVVSDYRLGQLTALTALNVLRAVRPTAALIVVAEGLEEQAAVACLRAGAEDLVSKGHTSRVGPAIDAAVALRQPLALLSPRQLEVLRLMAEGHSTRKIARVLTISVKTAEAHRAAVMRRLGIHDVAGLVRYAVRVGLVEPEPGTPGAP